MKGVVDKEWSYPGVMDTHVHECMYGITDKGSLPYIPSSLTKGYDK